MTDFSQLHPLDRAKKYRQLAGDARREAESADSTVRESYKLLAEHWGNLADKAEAEANPR